MLGPSGDTLVRGWCPHGGCTQGGPCAPHGRGERSKSQRRSCCCSSSREVLGEGTGVLVSGWGCECAATLGTPVAPGAGMAVSPYRTGSPGSGNVAAKASTSSFSAFSSPWYFGSSSLSLNSFSVALGFMSFCTRRASSIPARMGDVLVSPHSCCIPQLSQPCCSLGRSPAPSHLRDLLPWETSWNS